LTICEGNKKSARPLRFFQFTATKPLKQLFLLTSRYNNLNLI
jgi:hypothetical protein